jgi:hypothetical protein
MLPEGKDARARWQGYLSAVVFLVAALIAIGSSAQNTIETAPRMIQPPRGGRIGLGPSSPLSNLPAGSPGIPGTPGIAPGPEATSAAPPSHWHARHQRNRVEKEGQVERRGTDSDAERLNREELSRLQSGSFSPPAAPSGK